MNRDPTPISGKRAQRPTGPTNEAFPMTTRRTKSTTTARNSALALLAALPMGGCGSIAPPLPSGSAAPADAVRPPAVRDVLYVSSRSQNIVEGYRAHDKNPPPFRQITSGINGPSGMAVDSQCNLYID